MRVRALLAAAVCALSPLWTPLAVHGQGDSRIVLLLQELKQSSVTPEVEKRIPAAIDAIASMSMEQVSDALATIVPELSHEQESIQAVAALACLAVVRRPDGTELLRKSLPSVSALFGSTSARLNALAAMVLLNAKTVLGPDVTKHIVAAINRRDRSGADRIPALATAVRIAPTDDFVVDAVAGLMSETMDAATRVKALSAVGDSKIDGARLRVAVIAALQDTDRVKLAAISVLTRMGPTAISEAAGVLEQISQRGSETNEVRSAAERALQTLR